MAWDTVPTRSKKCIPSAASATFCDNDLSGLTGQVCQQLPGVSISNDCAGWNTDNTIWRIPPVLVFPSPVLATFCTQMLRIPQIGQRIKLGVNPEDNTAAIPAIAAIWTAPGPIFFAEEANTAFATVSSFDKDTDFVNKVHNRSI